MKPAKIPFAAAALLLWMAQSCAQGVSQPAAATRAKQKAEPAPAPALRADAGPRCAETSAAPTRVSLQMGKSTLLRLPDRVVNRSVGNPQVVQAMLVAPDTMYVVGVDVGSTNMIVQGRGGACMVVDITVSLDSSGLQSALAQALPDETGIRVSSAADSVVLTGTVADGAAVIRAGELAAAFVRRPVNSLLRKDDEDASRGSGRQASAGNAEVRVINLLNVQAPQQVMLEVKIAEVSKTLLERLEGSTAFNINSGSWAARLLSNFLSGQAQSLIQAEKSNGNLVGAAAQRQDSLVRMLAEPTVMALSGQEGSFLAGGSILIPVSQDNNKVTLEEKEFGVGLKFVPTVLAGGRINLKVSPEVSEISREGIGVSAAGIAGNSILPLITRRRASTTLQLMDGQSFAIGGLLRNNLVNNFKGLPGLGEIPVLGALFRSVDYQQDKTELVFVVTARLVKPLSGPVPLPTDSVVLPSRAELLLGGKVGQAAAAPPASPATTATAGGFELK